MKKYDKAGAPTRNQPAGPGARKQQARTTARSGFKVAVIDELVAKGFSRREATRAVSAIIESMKDAVKRGEVVETPFGAVKRTLIRRKQRLMRHWVTGKLMLVNRRPHWRIVFRPFPEYRE